MLQTTYHLLTIDLSMFGEGAAPAGGEGGAPAAAEAPAAPEVRYGKQPEQTAAPQQETQNPTTVDKGKQFADLIKGEFKDQYTEATQKIINRRFRDTDAKIQSQQPVMDLLASRYGIEDGDPAKIFSAVQADTAFWQEAADAAGMTVEQYRTMRELEAKNHRLEAAKQDQQAKYLAARRYAAWQAEADALKQKYPDFDLEEAQTNEMFMVLLKNNFPMESAYKSAFADRIAANAAASAEKAVTDNVRARGMRPKEAGTSNGAASTVKDDVSQLTDEDVLKILGQIKGGKKITFG